MEKTAPIVMMEVGEMEVGVMGILLDVETKLTDSFPQL
jgi:hypothetical protein